MKEWERCKQCTLAFPSLNKKGKCDLCNKPDVKTEKNSKLKDLEEIKKKEEQFKRDRFGGIAP